MQIAPRSETFGAVDRSWLATLHGSDSHGAVSVDCDNFLSTWTDGEVPAGVVVANRTSDDKAVRYNNAGSGGAETAVGITLNPFTARAGQTAMVAIVRHGTVYRDLLPTNNGLDTAAETDLRNIDFRTYA